MCGVLRRYPTTPECMSIRYRVESTSGEETFSVAAINLNATPARAADTSDNLVIKCDVTKCLSFCLQRGNMRMMCSG